MGAVLPCSEQPYSGLPRLILPGPARPGPAAAPPPPGRTGWILGTRGRSGYGGGQRCAAVPAASSPAPAEQRFTPGGCVYVWGVWWGGGGGV